jgi:hypothetical protein
MRRVKKAFTSSCAFLFATGFAARAFAQSSPPPPPPNEQDAGVVETPDAAPPQPVHSASEDAIAGLQAKQAELEHRLEQLTADQTARDAREVAAADVAKKKTATDPPPGVAFSALGVPVRVFGNATLRYDYSTNSNLTDSLTNGIQSNGLLMRIRFGAEFGDTGPVIGGIRLSSGETPNPAVPFVIIGDAFRPASFGIDQAWGSVRPFDDRGLLQITFGRMKNPFWRGSIGTVRTQLLWDDDVNPAGAAISGRIYKSTSKAFPFTIENTLAYMQIQSLLDNRFVGLTGVVSGAADQLRFLSTYVDAAISYYQWWNLNDGLSVPTSQPEQGYVSPQTAASAFLLLPGLQQTNTVVNYGPAGGSATGFLNTTFRILNPTAQVHIPIKKEILGDPDAYLIADYSHNFIPSRELTAQGNLATPSTNPCTSCTNVATTSGNKTTPELNNGIGITIGSRLGDKTYKRTFHPMNVWITYRYVQSDAALATFTDSDLGAGTGYRGFAFGSNYRVFKNLLVSIQYFDFMGYPLMENHVQRLFLDMMGDF